MRGRLGFFVGLGAGYVLGAKAGRERYEQLKRLFDNITNSEGFQQVSGRAKETVGSGLGTAKDKVGEGVHKVTDAVKDRRSTEGNLAVAPPS